MDEEMGQQSGTRKRLSDNSRNFQRSRKIFYGHLARFQNQIEQSGMMIFFFYEKRRWTYFSYWLNKIDSIDWQSFNVADPLKKEWQTKMSNVSKSFGLLSWFLECLFFLEERKSKEAMIQEVRWKSKPFLGDLRRDLKMTLKIEIWCSIGQKEWFVYTRWYWNHFQRFL